MKEKFDINNPDHLNRTKYDVVEWELDGRKPSSVSFGGSFRSDSSRRDFSFNALAIDSNGNIIDYHNGINDLQNKTVKTIGCPYDRFGEDFLRTVRAIRFAARFNFEIEECSSIAIKDCSIFLDKVSVERIFDEIYKMASYGGEVLARSIELMDSHGILCNILPELSCMKNYYHAVIHHPEGAIAIRKSDKKRFAYDYNIHNTEEYSVEMGTVWDHTIAAVRASKTKDPELNLAVLFHDIGKPASFRKKYDRKNNIEKHTYHGHDNVGIKVFEDICKRFKISNELKEKISFCIENHMKIHNFTSMKKSKVVSIITDKNWEFLKYVSFCDDSCRMNVFDLEKWNEMEKYVSDIFEQLEAQKNVFSCVNGDIVMSICNISPGPIIGKIIRFTNDYVITNNITDEKEIEQIILNSYSMFSQECN